MRALTAVGPVLITTDAGAAVVAALRAAHPDAVVEDRGAYVRVSVEGRCRVERVAIEAELGAPFELPADLEKVMPSFAGRLTIDEEGAEWRATP